MNTEKVLYRVKQYAIVCFLAIIYSSCAQADNRDGFYIGPSVGYASTDWGFLVTPELTSSGDWNLAAASAPIGASDNGMNFSALGGYRFSKYIAVEGSFTHLANSQITLDSANYILHPPAHDIDVPGDTFTFSTETKTIALQLKLFFYHPSHLLST